MNFAHHLRNVQESHSSLLCIGLDTDRSKLPASLRSEPDPVFAFNRQIIDATSDIVCAYKLNLAFYEALGERGGETLRRTLAQIPEGIITIGDAKRGDIGNTAALYATALFDVFGFGACTVNPYMGGDSVEPFCRNPERGVFLLAVTSNPGARDFQHLRVRGTPLYEHVVRKARSWNEHGNIGLVVGATRPRQLRRVREIVPHMPLLIPGIGAQGGDLKQAVRYGCDRDGFLAVINASRSVIYASAGEDFADAARSAALSLRDEINLYRRPSS